MVSQAQGCLKKAADAVVHGRGTATHMGELETGCADCHCDALACPGLADDSVTSINQADDSVISMQ